MSDTTAAALAKKQQLQTLLVATTGGAFTGLSGLVAIAVFRKPRFPGGVSGAE